VQRAACCEGRGTLPSKPRERFSPRHPAAGGPAGGEKERNGGGRSPDRRNLNFAVLIVWCWATEPLCKLAVQALIPPEIEGNWFWEVGEARGKIEVFAPQM